VLENTRGTFEFVAKFLRRVKERAAGRHEWLGPEPLLSDRLKIMSVTPQTLAGFARLFDSDFARAHRHSPEQMMTIHRSLDPTFGNPLGLILNTAILVPHDEPDVVVGFIMFFDTPSLPGTKNGSRLIGVQIAQERRGQGYLTEALAEVVRYLTAEGFRNVWLATSPDNVAMRRVCERLGFREHGTVYYTFPDGTVDDALAVEVIPSGV